MERATLPSSLSAHPAAPADQVMADAAHRATAATTNQNISSANKFVIVLATRYTRAFSRGEPRSPSRPLHLNTTHGHQPIQTHTPKAQDHHQERQDSTFHGA